ncbi:ribonuclease P protein component [Patescibacteria group bacterium]
MISKLYRLRRWRVQKVLNKGENKKVGLFIVKYLPNKCKYHRWSLVLSRKFEKLATVRNKKRRQIYEAIRNNLPSQPETEQFYDIVLIPHKQILSCNYDRIVQNTNDIFTSLAP